jgi:hypothetical protein
MQQTIRSAPLSGQQECPQPDLCNFEMREGKASLLLGNVFCRNQIIEQIHLIKLLHCTKAHIRVLAVELSCIQSELFRSLLWSCLFEPLDPLPCCCCGSLEPPLQMESLTNLTLRS